MQNTCWARLYHPRMLCGHGVRENMVAYITVCVLHCAHFTLPVCFGSCTFVSLHNGRAAWLCYHLYVVYFCLQAPLYIHIQCVCIIVDKESCSHQVPWGILLQTQVIPLISILTISFFCLSCSHVALRPGCFFYGVQAAIQAWHNMLGHN